MCEHSQCFAIVDWILDLFKLLIYDNTECTCCHLWKQQFTTSIAISIVVFGPFMWIQFSDT